MLGSQALEQGKERDLTAPHNGKPVGSLPF